MRKGTSVQIFLFTFIRKREGADKEKRAEESIEKRVKD